MIRYIGCLRRLNGVTQEEFRKYWSEPRFTELVGKTAKIFKADSFALNLTLLVPVTLDIRHARDSLVPFEGTLEYWWKNAKNIPSIEGALKDEEKRGWLQELGNYQKQFIDIKNSHFFFTEQRAMSRAP